MDDVTQLRVGAARAIPAELTFAVREVDDCWHSLFPCEQNAVCHAVAQRRYEFASGRSCARAALAALSVTPSAIPVGVHREPLWPEGCTGSISHSGGICIAATARIEHLDAVGIDLERNRPLDSGLRSLLCTPRECRQAESTILPSADAHMLVFSAKEAVYKAVFPRVRRILEFHEVEIDIHAEGRTWRPSGATPALEHFVKRIRGAYILTRGFVLTVAWQRSRQLGRDSAVRLPGGRNATVARDGS